MRVTGTVRAPGDKSITHRALLLALRGHWSEAEQRLRRLVAAVPDPGQLARLTLPPLGRLLARRGDPEAEALLRRGWTLALRNDTLLALEPAGVAMVEWAWLSGDMSRAGEQVEVLLERATGRVLVTSQNHGFAVEAGTGDDRAVTHESLYDGTVEGLSFPELHARSVQFHPEAGPGPHDAWPILGAWVEEVRGAAA